MVNVAALEAGQNEQAAKATRKRGGRASRVRNREEQATSASKAIWPGLPGGAYKPLTDHDLQRVHSTVLDVLEKVGVGDPPALLVEKALAKGCKINEHGRLCFPRSLVEDVITNACHSFTIHGRDSKYDIELGGQKVHYATAGEAVNMYDPVTKAYRPSTLVDLYDMARLVDKLDNLHRFCQTVVATEIVDTREHAINTAYAMVSGTNKSLAISILGPQDIADTISMFDMISGGEGKFKDEPFCSIGCCPILSPLRYGEDACDAAIATINLGVPCDFAVAPQAGATAPAALAGALVQVVAEVLASVLLTNLIAPGHPTTFAAWPFISDLRSGSFTGGGGEQAVLAAAGVQLGNFYNLPTTCGAGMSDSKVPDYQAGYEKAITNLLAGMAGANYVGEAAGMQASLMGCSFEAFVLDNDMLGSVERAIRGIEVTDETLSFNVIEDTVLGAGHFLGTDQTINLMESEFYYPELADRSAYGQWEEEGSKDINERADVRTKEILSSHYPSHIDPDMDKKIRDTFPIILDEADMTEGNDRW
ncbi:MAG: trimethylamine methyltransferase [Rhodospirillales bacterium]|jgi:trimethylamine---corrinoid protein Co-methyltransferase|nr:trimethylamine methyltransferase [Rhodospirillales bacterium]